jgi:hypothetical protein
LVENILKDQFGWFFLKITLDNNPLTFECNNNNDDHNYNNKNSDFSYVGIENTQTKIIFKHNYIKVVVDQPFINRNILVEVTKKQKGVYI